jgi:hypothetical protein
MSDAALPPETGATTWAGGSVFRPVQVIFYVAGFLSFVYAFYLPIEFYRVTDELLISDTSIYFLMGAVVLVLAERALESLEVKYHE